MIGQIVFCYNNAIYAQVGPPNGGPYIWIPSTRTYQYGPPMHSGNGFSVSLHRPTMPRLYPADHRLVRDMMTMEGVPIKNAACAAFFNGNSGQPYRTHIAADSLRRRAGVANFSATAEKYL